MQNKKFVYRIFKTFTPNPNDVGRLVFQIESIETGGNQQIFFTWMCHLEDQPRDGWFACQAEWKSNIQYDLLPLMKKMEKAYIRSSSTPEEVIDFLHANKIEHCIWANIYDKDQRVIFNGRLSVSEIFNGKFKRYDKTFIIPADQQNKLIDQIQEEKNLDIQKRKAA